ncbi:MULTISPECIES: hypothetical protein [unclassified Paenibacillus]|uniref:hypothetical protein n=1 Tax=unclassified Paenibacillus TaxID=185978 RepID=UPI0009549D2A|nr:MULTISPECIES: hypothetical protein [unclassified Paenibacillus]ASS68067.1 hypothetical protein CIC07_19470 [Paenibacillus sp. RUD330]SIR39995.1 hypothetical protein SAMN05880555_3655 [Paenibacillus sp. RU4X]SIR50294.1 hypothetical protein SAMN05880570_3656 [Paenibacillus sp. RU4T]
MAITVPVPTLGNVIVLTEVGDTAKGGCAFPGDGSIGTKIFNVAPGQLYIVGCNGFPAGGGTVAFIADAGDIDLADLITTILGLAVVQAQGSTINVFRAVPRIG